MKLRKINNKRGLLLAEQVIKIVLALIAITFLAYFLTTMYFSKVNSEKQELARAILVDGTDNLKSRIGTLLTEDTFLLHSPKGWYLFSFTGSKEKPTACEKKNCLCICDNVVDIFGRQISSCNEFGSCLAIENLKYYGESELEIAISSSPVTIIRLEKINDVISVSQTTTEVKA